MKRIPRNAAPVRALAVVLLTMALIPCPSLADHDKGREGKHGRGKAGRSAPAPAVNQTFEQECGACHWAYFPGLLPARSWEKILAQPDHFGERLAISPADLALVRAHLAANAADVSGNKRSGKIMKNIGSATPLRVTEVAYLRDKHRKLKPEIFQAQAVGGLGNCLACHPGAKAGDFDDDAVAIPR